MIDKYLGTGQGDAALDSMNIRNKIDRVKTYIRLNALKKITLIDAAKTVCMSPKYLSRIFKEQSGESFNDFKLGLKIDAAKHLLKSTGYTVEQITDRLGYQTAESFIRQFKKITRNTPGEFRKNGKA